MLCLFYGFSKAQNRMCIPSMVTMRDLVRVLGSFSHGNQPLAAGRSCKSGREPIALPLDKGPMISSN